MPLPKDAHEFLDDVVKNCRKGCVVHFYHFGPSDRLYEEAVSHIEDACRRNNRDFRILFWRRVRSYAPDIEQIVVDFQVI